METIQGFYGYPPQPTAIYIYDNDDGSKWYCAAGSVNVNLTCDNIDEDTNIEYLTDDDVFTWSSPINSEDDLLIAVED